MSTTSETSPTPSRATVTAPSKSNELKLSVPGVYELVDRPRERYEVHIRKVAVEVLKEASNLATPKGIGGKKHKEFHSDHVDEAFEHIARRGLKRNPKPWWYVVGRIFQSFSTLVVGTSGIFMAIPEADPFWGYCFAVSVAVTFLLQVVLEISDWNLSR